MLGRPVSLSERPARTSPQRTQRTSARIPASGEYLVIIAAAPGRSFPRFSTAQRKNSSYPSGTRWDYAAHGILALRTDPMPGPTSLPFETECLERERLLAEYLAATFDYSRMAIMLSMKSYAMSKVEYTLMQ